MAEEQVLLKNYCIPHLERVKRRLGCGSRHPQAVQRMGGQAGSERVPLTGRVLSASRTAGTMQQAAWFSAGLALLCCVVVMQSTYFPTVLESNVGARVENGVPIFDWSDTHNVNMFNKACADGNQDACNQLASNQEALNNLNDQARANARWGGDMFWTKKDQTFQHWGDNMVPLDDEYEYNELQGQVWVWVHVEVADRLGQGRM